MGDHMERALCLALCVAVLGVVAEDLEVGRRGGTGTLSGSLSLSFGGSNRAGNDEALSLGLGESVDEVLMAKDQKIKELEHKVAHGKRLCPQLSSSAALSEEATSVHEGGGCACACCCEKSE